MQRDEKPKMMLCCFFCYLLYMCLLKTAKCLPDVQLNPEGEYSAIYFSFVNFTCFGTGNSISWRVDNEELDDEELDRRSITIYKHSVSAGNVSSTLVVLASSENKDATFLCYVTDSSDFNFAFAILRVEGIAPVRNLDVKEISNGVLTVWEQPMFVQNLTSIRYGISVTGSGLTIFTANNIEDLQYIVSLNNFSLCSVYSFSVVAYEGLLQSDPESVSHQYTGDISISVDHHVMYEENSISIQYNVSVNSLCSLKMSITTEIDNEKTANNKWIIDVNPGIYSYASNLAPGIIGTVSYAVYDSLGSIKANTSVKFVTHHVTRVIAFIDGFICVECSFANGSDALGCEVEFRDRITDECEPCIKYAICRISNSSSASKCIPHTFEGNFSVVAYDIVGNETSQLRAAVYNDLPEYLIVPADNNHTAVIISSASVPNASPTLEVINLTATRFTKYTVEVPSSLLNETTVPVHTKMSLFLIPVIVSVTLFCTLLAVFIILVITVRLRLGSYRRKERKMVFEQTSEIAEKKIYQEGNVMLYRLRRSESVESNFQSVSEFVPGSDSSSLVIYTTPPFNSDSNLPYPVEAASGSTCTFSHIVQCHAYTHTMPDPQQNLPENQTSSNAIKIQCSPQAGSLSLSGVREYSIPVEYSLNLPISEPITMNTPSSTKMDSSNPHPCWCSFNSERQNTCMLQYAEIDFNRKPPPALERTQYSSVKRDINETNGYCTTNNAIYEEVNKENLNFEEVPTPQAYVGIDEIKSRKLTIKDTRYAELDVPPPTSPPPPVPGTTTYSTIVQLDHKLALLPAYVDVKKIKERKKAGIKASLDSSSPDSQNKMLIELQELPPPTPTHDLSTPPPDTPPPIPPCPSSALYSPSSRTPLNVMVNNSRFS